MDYKHFKKVHEDDGSTTLRHYAGHELRVAHNKLSAKEKEKLKALPLAKGGKVEKQEGMSDQGKAVRKAHDYAKSGDEMGKIASEGASNAAKGYAHARHLSEKSNKPKLKGLAEGGRIKAAWGFGDGGIEDEFKSTADENKRQSDLENPIPEQPEGVYPDATNVNITHGGAPISEGMEDQTAMPPKGPQELHVDNSPMQVAALESKDPYEAPARGPQGLEEPARADVAEKPPQQIQEPVQDNQPAQPQAPQAQVQRHLGHAIANPTSPQEAEQTLNQEYADAKQRVLSGEVNPKTYADLYAKKDTLGKIGTIFGLMLSGFGSGLSGQPNALLEMMNKEIDRDLEAQKQNQGNRMNWLQAVNQHHETLANLALKGVQAKEAQAQTGLIKANTLVANNEAAKSKMMLGALGSLMNQVQGMPPGPMKQNATQSLGMVSNAIDQRAAQGNAQAAEQMFQNRQRLGAFVPEMSGVMKWETEHHQPGMEGSSSVPLSSDNRSYINAGTQFQNQLDNFIKFSKQHSGSLDPRVINRGKAMAAELQGAYRQATNGGVYKEGEQNFIQKLISDDPTKFLSNVRVIPQLESLSGTNKEKMGTYTKNLGFSGTAPGMEEKSQASGPKNGQKSQSASGKPIVFKDGKWRYL